MPDGPQGTRRREDVTGVRPLVEPRGLVDGSARDERVPGHDLAGRETDAGGEARGAERHSRRDRAQRVVVPGRRDAEHAEHASAAEPGDARAVVSELLLGGAGPLEQGGALSLRVVERVRRSDVRDEDGDELARLREHWRRRNGSRGGRGRVGDRCVLRRDEVERPVLLQHPPLELLEPRRRIDPELVVERSAESLERVQRFGVPAAAVERQHQLATRPLAERMAAYECLELGDELRLAPEGKLGVDALLEAGELLFDEPCLLQPGEGLCELRERHAAPQVERTRSSRAASSKRPSASASRPRACSSSNTCRSSV